MRHPLVNTGLDCISARKSIESQAGTM